MGNRADCRVARGARADPPDKGMALHWDTEVEEFGLPITPAGATGRVLNFRSHGIQRQRTIGNFPDWTAKLARDEAKRLKRLVDQGEDPMADRHADRKAPTLNDLGRKAPTLKDLATHYIKVHLPRKRPSSQTMDKLGLTPACAAATRGQRGSKCLT
jgi:Arm DNA-binding domain